LAGLDHRKFANGNILPGVVDAARRLLASAKNASDRVSPMANANQNGPSDAQHPQQAQNAPQIPHVHLTQRQLHAPVGSRVRGVEMLPSVDVPNIPATEITLPVSIPAQRVKEW
jgi:hypothetical protein